MAVADRTRIAGVVGAIAAGMIASIDGCKGGWMIALADCWPSLAPIQFLHATDFVDCISKTAHCKAVMVDMPIGLPAGTEKRQCDVQARKMLAETPGSVFRTPPRSTLGAKRPERFQELHKTVAGEGAGLPVWGILPKLIEVDDVMRVNPALQSRVREFHPELAWRRVGGKSLRSKHTGAGLLQRIGILNRASPNWLGDTSGMDLPKSVHLDDMLDAVVGLPVAQGIVDGAHPLRRLPEGEPPIDEYGLRMEIWY